MDKLKECAMAFLKLCNVRYRCIIGRKGKKREIILSFSPYEFLHLSGLNKLSDKPFIRGNRERIFKNILSDMISFSMVSSSKDFHIISNRLIYLCRLEEFLDSNTIIFSYDKRNSKSSRIDAKYLLQNSLDDEIAYYFISDNNYNDTLIGVSFFLKDEVDYTIAQPRWTLLYKEKLFCDTGKTEVHYDILQGGE